MRKNVKWLTKVSLIMSVALAMTACDFFNKTAEEKGKELASAKIDLVKGVGGVLEEKGSAAAESVATGLGKVLSGAGKGIEKSGTQIVLAPSVSQAGLDVTKIQYALHYSGDEKPPVLEAYVIANANVDGKIKVQLFSLLDKEIGRAKVSVKQGADEAKYWSITLDKEVNTNDIAKVVFDFQPAEVVAKK